MAARLGDDAVPIEVDFINPRFFSPMLLIVGAGFCFLGFVFVTAIGIINFVYQDTNPSLGITYPSGHGYFQSTVSEMVSDSDSPIGSIFSTFALCAALCIFMSFYPYMLRNVFTGSDTVPVLRIYWSSVRQMAPPLGLLILAGVSAYPTPVAMASVGKVMLWSKFIHLVGAGMLFVGFLVCEMWCLDLSGRECFQRYRSSGQRRANLAMRQDEPLVRLVLAWISLVFYVIFCLVQFALVGANGKICCADVWEQKGAEIIINGTVHILQSPQLTDTASSTYLGLKILSFTAEIIAAVAIVVSHAAVWKFCHERDMDYGAMSLSKLKRRNITKAEEDLLEEEEEKEYEDEDEDEDDDDEEEARTKSLIQS